MIQGVAEIRQRKFANYRACTQLQTYANPSLNTQRGRRSVSVTIPMRKRACSVLPAGAHMRRRYLPKCLCQCAIGDVAFNVCPESWQSRAGSWLALPHKSALSQNGTDDGAPDNNGADTAEANSQLTSNAHFSPASEDPASGGAMPANSCSDSATIGIASALAILNGPERGSNATSYTADRGQPVRARQEEQGGREDRGSGGAGDGVSSGGRGEGRAPQDLCSCRQVHAMTVGWGGSLGCIDASTVQQSCVTEA